MNGNCHLINGLTVSAMVSLNIDFIANYTPIIITNKPAAIALIVMGGIIGSIFPDIDNINSNMGQLCKPFSTMINSIQMLFGKTGSNHRGIFHDIFLYVFGLFFSLLYTPYLTGFFIGGLSHIFLDSFNPSGVPYIFGIGKFRIAKVLSGSETSVKVSWLLAILMLVSGLSLFLYTKNIGF